MRKFDNNFNKIESLILNSEAAFNKSTIQEILIAQEIDINTSKDESGRTFLRWAIYNGQNYLIELLVECGADVNERDENGCTPLHTATVGNNEKAVNLLVSLGADVNAKANDGTPPLYPALRHHEKSIATLLLEHGAKISAKDEWSEEALRHAAHHGSNDTLELLLRHGVDVNAVNGEYNKTALHTALDIEVDEKDAESELMETIKLLIKYRADLNIKNSNGLTPVVYAFIVGYTRIVELLLLNGADVKPLSEYLEQIAASSGATTHDAHTENHSDESPLFIACKCGDVELIRVLVEQGANVDEKNEHGATPLHLACRDGEMEIAKLLIALGANVNEREDNEAGRTPLHASCEAGIDDEDEITLLLIKNGADVNAKDNHGKTPLLLAREWSGSKTQALIKHGAQWWL